MNYAFKEGVDKYCAEKEITYNKLASIASLHPMQIYYHVKKDLAADLFLDRLEVALQLPYGYWKRKQPKPTHMQHTVKTVNTGDGIGAVNSIFVRDIKNATVSAGAGASVSAGGASQQDKPAQESKEAFDFDLYMLKSELEVLKIKFRIGLEEKIGELKRLMRQFEELQQAKKTR